MNEFLMYSGVLAWLYWIVFVLIKISDFFSKDKRQFRRGGMQ